jgi:hypothetical protein
MMHQVSGKKVSTDRSWYGLLEYPNCLKEPADYSEKILARGYLSKRLDRGTNIEAAIATKGGYLKSSLTESSICY